MKKGRDWRREVEARLQETIRLRQELLKDVSVVVEIGRRMADCLNRGNTIFLCGNGGSAADSQHIAAELVGRFHIERRGLPAHSLTTDTSALTAIGNDYGYDRTFSRQIEALGRKGDLLIGISTSGSSANVLAAVEAAKGMGIGTVGFTGRKGGKLKGAAEVCFCAPSDETPRIQELHITVGHIACEIAEEAFLG